MADVRRRLAAVCGAVAVLGLFLGVALAARVEVGRPAGHAELRLALRTTRARLELYHERSDAELAALPAHLRQRRVREELAIDYRLTVTIDGVERLERRVSHHGVRRTRPLAVDEKLIVEPGRRRVEVSFLPIPPESIDGREPEPGERHERDEDEDDDENDHRLADAYAALAAPRLAAEIEFRAGRAELVVLDASGALRLEVAR